MSFLAGQTEAEKLVLRKSDLDTHMQVIGASGVGKSYFLEHLLREKIKKGHGVCLIDPHGEIYDNLVTWLACSGYRAHETHLINPGNSEFSVGFNPLAIDREPTRSVTDMLMAILRVWGGDSMSDTPRLNKCLRMTLYALAHHKLSLLEAGIFTSTRHKALRQKLVAELPIEEHREEWAEFDTYSDKEYREYFESTRSRIFEFVTAPAVRPIIGQTENVLNFQDCMERQHVVLVNLSESGSFHKLEGQLLGAMLMAEMYASAKQRKVSKAKSKPFYAVIDECASYINEDICASLDETRKFGLHYILSHQRLQQLRNVSDDCYDAVMANAQTKVVFRVNDDENAQTLCYQLFRSEFDLEKPKESLNKPVAVGQELIELFSSSETRGESKTEAIGESYGSSSGFGSGQSDGTGIYTPDSGHGVLGPDFTNPAGMTNSTGKSSSSMHGHSEARSSISAESITTSYTHGSSQSLKTVYEVMPTAVYSLEEVAHLGTRVIRELPNRTALVALPGQKPVRINTLDVNSFRPLPNQVARLVNRVSEKSRFTKPKSTVEKLIGDRAARLSGSDDDVFEERYDAADFYE